MGKSMTPPPDYPCRRGDCALTVKTYGNEKDYIDHLREDHRDDGGAQYMVNMHRRTHSRLVAPVGGWPGLS